MSRGKTVWIINEYAGSPYHGMEYRHYYVGKKLLEYGFNVYIIAASFSHLFFKKPNVNSDFNVENIDGIDYLWLKTPKYESSHDKKRVLKWLIFLYKTYLKLPIRSLRKPDFIIASSPSLFPILSAYKWSKKLKAKFLVEIRDIWPLTLVELGGYSPRHPFIKLMESIERFAYKKADKIISVLPLFNKYLEDIGYNPDKFVYIPNGICIDELSEKEPLPRNIMDRIPMNKFLITYAGTFGKANALEYLIEAAKLLKDNSNIRFMLVGKGSEEGRLRNMVENLKLNNVTFIPPVSKRQVQEILKLSDVCYIGWLKKKIYTYGISANKIFDYMYTGTPILHSYSGKADIIKQARCGISVEAENPKAIAQAILKFYNISSLERKEMGKRGKNYLLKFYTYEKIAEKFRDTMLSSANSEY